MFVFAFDGKPSDDITLKREVRFIILAVLLADTPALPRLNSKHSELFARSVKAVRMERGVSSPRPLAKANLNPTPPNPPQ